MLDEQLVQNRPPDAQSRPRPKAGGNRIALIAETDAPQFCSARVGKFDA
jgi:hypothetical protein